MGKTSLIKFQIGPVQDFIAAARSTRDLWSGSYLLSFLVAAGIKAIPDDGSTLIFPQAKGQPLLDNEKQPTLAEKLIPNLPNLFVVSVPTEEAEEIAEKVKQAIQTKWEEIAKSVWEKVPSALGFHDNEEIRTRFDTQVSRHLKVSWKATVIKGEDYAKAYRDNGWHLDAVRQLRYFDAWGGGMWKIGAEKDSLTGKEEALCGGPGFADAMEKNGGEIPSLFKHDDHIGAITLIKRTWHLAYLGVHSKDFPIRSIPEIAARKKGAGEEWDGKEEGGNGYIAAIAFDGDSIGKWMDGRELPPGQDLLGHHQKFSAALSDFALGKVRKIIEEGAGEGHFADVPLGQLIYAGGDDVVALVPADVALECAKALRNAFRESTTGIVDKNGATPDASAGIAIAHVKSPMQDLIRAAQVAEKRAKNEIGRPAFSVALMKRSGEISHWGAKWDGGGIELSGKIAELMTAGGLSAKFPHRVCQLLEPYVTGRTGLSRQEEVDGFDANAVIPKEFAFAIRRQSTGKSYPADLDGLVKAARTYLGNIAEEYAKKPAQEISLNQALLTAITGLCVTTAFLHRHPTEKQQPDSQPAQSAIA